MSTTSHHLGTAELLNSKNKYCTWNSKELPRTVYVTILSLCVFCNNPVVDEVYNIRAILTKEAVLNFVNKIIIVVHIMREPEKAGVITPDKYRGSKIHGANESVQNKYIL